MNNAVLKRKMDFLFREVYGITLEEMDIENQEHAMIIFGIDWLDNFYDETYTYFILPEADLSMEYTLYRVIGSGKYGYTVEDLGYVYPLGNDAIIDKSGKCYWKKYKEDYTFIKLKVEQLKKYYGFDGLYHYTDFSNLNSIFGSGYLISRNECEYQGIRFLDSASKSVLYHTPMYIKEYVRFHFRPKSPFLYVNEGIKLREYMNDYPHLPIPVCLVFDEELIYLDTTMFTDRNPGCIDMKIGNDYEFFFGIEWNKVFNCIYYSNKEWKNKMQAELLSKVPVSLDYLKKIVFRCEADMKRAINLFGYDERYVVDLGVFSEKNSSSTSKTFYYNNFISDYDIYNLKKEIGLNMLILKLKFNKPWRGGYDVKILIKTSDNKIIKSIMLNSEDVQEIASNKTINYIIHDFNKDFHRLEVYLNDILSIEENLENYR